MVVVAKKTRQQGEGKTESKPSSGSVVVPLAEVIERYVGLQHRIAAVNLLLRTVEPYIPSDSGPPSSTHHDRTCLNPVVSSDAFDELWLLLRNVRDDYKKQMDSLSEVSMVDPSAAVSVVGDDVDDTDRH